MGKPEKVKEEVSRKEQECLKRVWQSLNKLRFELACVPVLGQTKKQEQFDWFDRVDNYIIDLKTASDCRKHAKDLDTLADAISRKIGPKRELEPSFEKSLLKSSEVVITESEQTQLISRVDKMTNSIRRRMKHLHIEIAKPETPKINIETGGTKWVYVIGVVSLYPAMFATLAREMALPLLAPALSMIGAFLSFIFFVEIAAVFIARPFWVYDLEAAGKLTYEIVDRGYWGAALLMPIALIIMQGRWFLEALWSLILPVDPFGYGLMASIVIALVGVLYYLTKWRYNQYLFCPVCGFKAVSHDALVAHCKDKYGYTLKEIVESSLGEMGAKKVTPKERRATMFLGMGFFYLIVVVFDYINDQNFERFLFFLTFCSFFLALDVLEADYYSYKKEKEAQSEKERTANSNVARFAIFIFSFILIMTSLIGSASIFLLSGMNIVPNPLITSAIQNMGIGVLLTLAPMKVSLRGFVRGTPWSSLPISWKKALGYSAFVYSTNFIIGYWAYNVIAMTEYYFLFGHFAGLIITILCVRDIWHHLRKQYPIEKKSR